MNPSARQSGAPTSDADQTVDYSVVLPCLNEAQAVGVCVEKARRALAAMGVAGEVVVVDNGSSDGSPEIAAAAGARVVREARRGYGSAYLCGFGAARGRFLAMGDADDTYDFLDLPRFFAPLASGEADFVIGTRIKGTILPGAMTWSHRWIGNPILSGMLRLFFRTSVSDSHCGLRAFTREAWERMALQTTGMEFASEMVVKSLRARLRLREVPITYHPRIGESKLEGVRDAWRHVRFMLLFSPSWLFLLPAAVLLLLGATLVSLLAAGPREFLGRSWDYHPLLFGCLALVLGANVAIFDVVAKVFSATNGFAALSPRMRRFLDAFTLERGLLAGGLALLAGLGLETKIVLDWARTGYGDFMAVRGVVLGMTAIVLGCQTLFASFLVSLLVLPRRP